MASSLLGRLAPPFIGLLALLVIGCPPLRAQPGVTGAIEGRVFDAGRGEYLESALITLEATGAEALTETTGQYRLSRVPAGTATVRVFFTGLGSLTS